MYSNFYSRFIKENVNFFQFQLALNGFFAEIFLVEFGKQYTSTVSTLSGRPMTVGVCLDRGINLPQVSVRRDV